MPELPDITVYLECLAPRVVGQPLEQLLIRNPFVLRSVAPSPAELAGARVIGLRRLGKRIVFALEGERFVVVHLMIAGRLRWSAAGAKPPGKLALALFTFPTGTLVLTEAGTKRRASIHLVAGEEGLESFRRGGLEVLEADQGQFAERLRSENHTLKRALTDPRLFSGIGNAYSDEILHRARLSPLALSRKLDDASVARLFEATRATLLDWTARLRAEVGSGFPDKVTAFREGMAVHGRYREPCPVCGAPVQRIRYADNETNYCARCQTGGRLLADRAMSRLLHEDWPRSIDEVE
jgi:formamidopyrimidine-DNA glycosylase